MSAVATLLPGGPAPLPVEECPAVTLSVLVPEDAAAQLGRHRSALYGFIRRKGFSAEEADDLTQETLIRAFLHLPGFRGVSLDAWLYRIAANVSVDYLRKRRVATVPLESVVALDSEDEDPLARLSRDERRERVLGVIADLPECHRRILRLRYYEDRSLAEIATEVNCTPMAAKLRVFRAVAALRRHWRDLSLDRDALAG